MNPPREDRPKPQALIVASAGNVCVGWSSEGKRARGAHPSQHPLACWVAQRLHLAREQQEDMFTQECTPMFDINSNIAQPLQETHLVLHVVAGPRLIGWPTSRDRILSVGLNRHTLVWTGPPPEKVQEHFESLWGRSPQVNGDVFFQEGPDVQLQFLHEAMRKGGYEHDPFAHSLQATDRRILQYALAPGQLQRLEKYQELQDEFSAIDGTFIVDLDHWPHSPGPGYGPMFPVLLRHGTVVNLATWQMAMPRDRLLSLGFHAHECVGERFWWPLTETVLGCSDRVIKQLTGNSQCLPVIYAWHLYVFCHTCRREIPDVWKERVGVPPETSETDSEAATEKLGGGLCQEDDSDEL